MCITNVSVATSWFNGYKAWFATLNHAGFNLNIIIDLWRLSAQSSIQRYDYF